MENIISGLGFWIFLGAVAVWTLFWKGWALWRSARSSHKKWFVVMLILNTVGILEILYLFVFSKKALRNSEERSA